MSDMAVQAWLEAAVSKRGDVTSALLVWGVHDRPDAASRWPADQPPDGQLLAVARSRLSGRSQEQVPTPAPPGIVTQWVRSEGKVVGTLAMRVTEAPLAPAPAPTQTLALSLSLSLALALAPAQRAANAGRLQAGSAEPPANAAPSLPTPPEAAASQQAIGLMSLALAQPRLDRCAAALATELATAFGCKRVFVGVSVRRFVQVIGLSHGSVTGPGQVMAGLVGAAMDESVDQGASVCHPQHPEDRPRVTLAHARLTAAATGLCVLTVPMFAGGEPVGALTFERDHANRFDLPTTQRLEAIATLLAPLLRLKVSNERSAWQRLRAALGIDIAALGRRQRLTLALGSAGATAALVAVMVMPWSFQISAPVRLEGRIQRAVVAPADGFLKSALVRAGDAVKEGQLLAELNDEDLRLERRRWETEVARFENTYAEAQAKQDRAQLVMADARVAESRAQLELVDQQIARTRLIAPFDALVIKGDLAQQLGAPVKRGDLLLTLTPSRELRVMLDIDERDVASVQPGSRGALTLSALPDRRFSFVIDRVMPVARAEAGRNLFEAEARMAGVPDADLPSLRPGLQGMARIDAGERPLYWLLGHRALDWLRLQWWAWLG